ncbi:MULTISPECIES: hypothetical protein [unclassified Rhodococcus (in: high G+C Gram-positive bacteria)]|jgi:hypothetical protein|uniref:hypothetical protein n=1 Tax=unclassified Rhodococcus (in: high G+C Gram-positive bacteria) TaxID=192944 RepID=UPI000B3D232F|nr:MULTISPECIES: hypothetical protein [unclassified Rhodococcus (in: high G+C Gram-positive bacteria)]KAF0966511.1 hypothetical protein MLGJGCBP_00312 [Rhodococcus sp. T7]OUS95181.1 hypothetical protein CA951_14155 [Rhodococcus sp. NCIMB 12038]
MTAVATETVGEPEEAFGTEWLRLALRRCELLAQMHSVSSDARWMISFAIQWAPFGGASAAELLERFGVNRRRFMELVLDGLAPKATDIQKIRAMKGQLRTSLAQAWGVQ